MQADNNDDLYADLHGTALTPRETATLPALASLDTFRNQVVCADALTLLSQLPSASIDAVITDPPYNMTKLDFEQAIDWPAFWSECRRIAASPNVPFILFSQQPFTTDLINSNRRAFRYEIIYEKSMPTGFLDANRRPLRAHENILVFADASSFYDPVMERTTDLKHKHVASLPANHYGKHEARPIYADNGTRYPRSVWKFAQRNTALTLHPTQKPLALIERLLLTYTRVNALVVDPFCGSGTLAIAARNTNRQFICGDNNPEYIEIARKRLQHGYTIPMFD